MTDSRSLIMHGGIVFAVFFALTFASAASAAAEPGDIGVASEVASKRDGELDQRKRLKSDRIVGGQATTVAKWPWQVALAYDEVLVPGGDGFQRQFCGGTLVAPRIVITAAHCVYDNPLPVGFNDPSNFDVFTGRTRLSSTEGQEIQVQDYFFVTGAYNPAEDEDYDYVVMLLAQPSTATPIKLAGADEESIWAAGRPAFVTGWGDTASGAGDYQDVLREARVQIISDSFCTGPGSYGGLFHPATMLCAGVPGGGIDSCQGDSGGPIVSPISGGGFRLVGDTSWGFGCAEAQFPGVYARLGDDEIRSQLQVIFDFINTNVGAGLASNIFGSGAKPMEAPDTTITKSPKNKIKTKKKKVKIKYEFTNAEPSATAVCDLDGKVTGPCISPFTAKVKKGKHTMTIGSINPIGDVDATPATDKFKVKKKKKRR